MTGPAGFCKTMWYKFRGLTEVPVGNKREANDFMLSGTMTRWFGMLGTSDVFFAGVWAPAARCITNPMSRPGFRRLAILDPIPLLGDYLRVPLSRDMAARSAAPRFARSHHNPILRRRPSAWATTVTGTIRLHGKSNWRSPRLRAVCGSPRRCAGRTFVSLSRCGIPLHV
ncbi:MAG: hypothetical protein MRJ92_03305 [Nitrospira sp.]|nr:hypothetical protein [Nitrospira sp.]